MVLTPLIFSQVINFLLNTEIIPLCLRIMQNGTDLSKTVATFILQKILLDDTGLMYICQTFERFKNVSLHYTTSNYCTSSVINYRVELSAVSSCISSASCRVIEGSILSPFSHQVATILESMVESLAREPSARLLKHVVRCYLRLTDNPRAREALARQYLPNHLKDSTFMDMLQDDTSTKRYNINLIDSKCSV